MRNQQFYRLLIFIKLFFYHTHHTLVLVLVLLRGQFKSQITSFYPLRSRAHHDSKKKKNVVKKLCILPPKNEKLPDPSPEMLLVSVPAPIVRSFQDLCLVFLVPLAQLSSAQTDALKCEDCSKPPNNQPCEFCDEKFKQISDLRKHIHEKHLEDKSSQVSTISIIPNFTSSNFEEYQCFCRMSKGRPLSLTRS